MKRPEQNLGMTPGFVLPGLLHLTASNSYWLGMAMFRVQEFYESKHDSIRGQVFSFETAMDMYAKPSGVFDYADQWSAFNVPGEVVDSFFVKYHGMLTEKEQFLRSLINTYRMESTRYYLIGTVNGAHPGYLKHELAHAAFYLDPAYRKTMTDLVKRIPARDRARMGKSLTDEGYSVSVHVDELQAYLATDTKSDNVEMFGYHPACSGRFRDAYKAYFRKKPES